MRIFMALVGGLGLAITAPATAELYKYADERGTVIFSSVPLPGRTPIAVIGAGAPLPPRASPGASESLRPPSSVDSPRPSAGTESPRPASTAGGIYKYKDDAGNDIISAVPLPGRTPVAIIPPATGSTTARTPATVSPSGSSPPSSSVSMAEPSFKVSGDSQRGRDDLRRRILEDELANEMSLIAAVKGSYNDGQPVRLPEESANPRLYDERIKRLGEELRIHQSNITALQRELSRVK